MTPLNIKDMLKRSVAMLPAVSASGRATIRACANVEAKMKNWIQKRRIRPWRWEDWIPKVG